MLTATDALGRLKAHYRDDTLEFMRILLNSKSPTEANLALEVLRTSVPERDLVGACNLREVLAAFPHAPFCMRVDEQTLSRVCGMDRGIAAMSKVLDDGCVLAVTTAGNLVLDVIVKRDGEKYFLNPAASNEDFVTPEVVDLFFTSDTLLDNVIDLVKEMGVVFNPKFYLSLEDWHLEYAQDVFSGLEGLF